MGFLGPFGLIVVRICGGVCARRTQQRAHRIYRGVPYTAAAAVCTLLCVRQYTEYIFTPYNAGGISLWPEIQPYNRSRGGTPHGCIAAALRVIAVDCRRQLFFWGIGCQKTRNFTAANRLWIDKNARENVLSDARSIVFLLY